MLRAGVGLAAAAAAAAAAARDETVVAAAYDGAVRDLLGLETLAGLIGFPALALDGLFSAMVAIRRWQQLELTVGGLVLLTRQQLTLLVLQVTWI